MIDHRTLDLLLQGVNNVTWQSLVMIAIALALMYLAIVRDYEPLLLLPIAAGCMLANLPLSPLIAQEGMLKILYDFGIGNELFPLLIFIGIGALTDFGPLLENPRLVLLGAAGQFGIFLTLILALLLGFTQPEAASIGIIGAIDGPTSIYVSGILAPHMLGPITVAAYSYMSLVPIILPPVVRLLTTQRERQIRMPYRSRKISRRTRILFPVVVTIVVGILVLGLLAFILDGAAGVLFAKLLNWLSGGKVNPMIGAAGISAFPMAARVVQRMAHEEDFENYLLMHAMGANAAGQVASVVAGGVLLALMGTA